MRPSLVLQFHIFLEDSTNAQFVQIKINVMHNICSLNKISEQIIIIIYLAYYPLRKLGNNVNVIKL